MGVVGVFSVNLICGQSLRKGPFSDHGAQKELLNTLCVDASWWREKLLPVFSWFVLVPHQDVQGLLEFLYFYKN